MRSRIWLVLIVVVIVVAGLTVYVAITKPNEAEFVHWMETTYGIECMDYTCDAFKLTEEGKKEPIVIQTVHGSYNPGPFVMEVVRQYRNVEDSSYRLDISVKGFLGKFTVEEESINKIAKE